MESGNHQLRLVLRDDPRTARAIDRADPFSGRYEHDHRVNALRDWERRRADRSAE
ncbi:hypothetical protein ACFCV8_00060 [Streptomyces sp. NPDC056347]|uniref:hypothetical protein n=1 Tax=Streptomyces sp. NPDC056347 TaxID=3345790 RepID=UPI0035DEC5C5